MSKKVELSLNKFNEFYEEYVEWECMPFNAMIKVSKYFVEPVLDVGCFTGQKAGFYFSKGFTGIEGCDIAESKLAEARVSFPLINFFRHDFSLKSTERKFNSIYSFNVIEHIINYQSFLKNCFDSLNDKGFCVVDTPNVCSLITRGRLLFGDSRNFTGNLDESHLRFFNRSVLESAFRKAGFRVVDCVGYNVRGFFKSFEFLLPVSWREGIIVVGVKEQKK